MRAVIRKMGNSSGVIIPKPLLTAMGADTGDGVDMVVEGGRLVVQPLREGSRAGWAEDAKRLAEAGEDALAWPEFGNEGDDLLTW